MTQQDMFREDREPDLTSYDIILVNTSAGKDSQVMLDVVVNLATAQGVRERLVAVHCDLGRVEWQGTAALAKRQADHYGIRFEIVKRNKGDLLTHIEERGMFPSNTARYCTSDHKRAQACRVLADIQTAQGAGSELHGSEGRRIADTGEAGSVYRRRPDV